MRNTAAVVAAAGPRYSALMPDPGAKKVNYSHAVRTKEVLQLPFPLAVTSTWDAFWRGLYQRATAALDRQGKMLVERGNLTEAELKNYVEVQRNGLVKEFRRPLTPMGRAYSEILKPSKDLPTVAKLLSQKGSFEAVLRGVGSTRATVNRLAVTIKAAGPFAIAVEITMTAVVIELAPPQDKERVVAKQAGGAVGSIGGGLAGGWAGCAALSTLVSPSLMVPVIGEVTTAGACMIGGMLGTIGLGALGRWLGEKGGEAAHDTVNEWQWQ